MFVSLLARIIHVAERHAFDWHFYAGYKPHQGDYWPEPSSRLGAGLVRWLLDRFYRLERPLMRLHECIERRRALRGNWAGSQHAHWCVANGYAVEAYDDIPF